MTDIPFFSTRSPFHDEIVNNKLWGHLYDGRAIIGPVTTDFLEGSTLDECRDSFNAMSANEKFRVTKNWAYGYPPPLLLYILPRLLLT